MKSEVGRVLGGRSTELGRNFGFWRGKYEVL